MPDNINEFSAEDITAFLASDGAKVYTDVIREDTREGIMANNHRLKGEKLTAERNLQESETKFTALSVEYNTLKDNPETVEVQIGDADVEKRINEAVGRSNTVHTEQLDAAKSVTTGLVGKLINSDLTEKVNQAINKAGGEADFLLIGHIKNRIKSEYDYESGKIIHQIVNDKGEVEYTGNGEFDIDSLVGNFKTDERFKLAFPKIKKGGSGHQQGDDTKQSTPNKWTD